MKHHVVKELRKIGGRTQYPFKHIKLCSVTEGTNVIAFSTPDLPTADTFRNRAIMYYRSQGVTVSTRLIREEDCNYVYVFLRRIMEDVDAALPAIHEEVKANG